VPSVVIKSESPSKPNQEIVNETNAQNHLSNRDDPKTFVAYFNHLHNSLRRALTTWCWKIPEFQRTSCLQTHLLSNIVTCISVRFSFTFYVSVCLSLSLSFSSICLNMLSISFQKQEMQKGCRDLNSYEITIFYSMIIYNIIIYDVLFFQLAYLIIVIYIYIFIY